MSACRHCGAASEGVATFCTACGKPLPPLDDFAGVATPPIGQLDAPAHDALEPGAVIAGRYRIGDIVGEGGMGIVYRATESIGTFEREVALKLIRPECLADDQAVDRLIDEGMLTQDIRHPNVVTVYNVSAADGRPFVAMELVEGVSLRSWLRGKQEAPFDVAAAIIHAVLDGLEAAHSLGVVHRDLKPENVMLTAEPDGQRAPLKLLDFGIAQVAGSEASGRVAQSTPYYRAPEQETNPASVDPRTDIYALSVMLYELLMGVLPTRHWQPVSAAREEVPAAVDELIVAGLGAPQARPKSVAEFRDRLEAAIGLASVQQAAPAQTGGDEGQEAELVPDADNAGRVTVRKGALFVRPLRDANGKWYMPDMIDDQGNRTKWSKLWGYSRAFLK